MFMKLDIQKAYGMVDCQFLCKVLEAFGFSHEWINLIFKFISTPKISVLINGMPKDLFEILRCIRQGDPLSPSLFIIMAEAFGRAVFDGYYNQKIYGIIVARNMPNIIHKQYTNIIILPGRSIVSKALGLKAIIKSYMVVSGQKLNENKSENYFLNTKKEIEDQICKLMGYKKGHFPCKYLIIDLEKGVKSSKVWHNTFKKLDARIRSWKDKWLSKVGKATKISFVSLAIPIYPLSYLPISKSNWLKFEANLRNFL